MLEPALARSVRATQWRRHCRRAVLINQIRLASSQPPAARPYKPTSRSTDKQYPTSTSPPDTEPRTSILRYIWPFSKGVRTSAPPQQQREAPDPGRGQKATDRVVQTGHLDGRYKDAARRVTAIICAMPLVIYLGYELFRRRFEGVERKPLPKPKSRDEEMETRNGGLEGEGQGVR